MADDLRKLVERCLEGDQNAMIQLVERYQSAVLGFCYRMLGQRQDAEDAAQETFVRVLRSLSRWDSGRDFRPWLMAIAANRCRTLAASRRRRPIPCTIQEDQFQDESPDWQSADHLDEEIQLGLSRINPDQRQAFVLFHEHHLSYEQIAEALGCPLGTAKTWIYRARRQLAGWLQKREIVPGQH
ncbi:MAG: RNA polymerase sigma factor [Planctomycetes bacterium]|nr:RNA polymerase sigma factor [Planctomycetota bacterium]